MRDLLVKLHRRIETLPDELYPFRQNIEGTWVRGKKAYQHTVEAAFKRYGAGSFSRNLLFYRGIWHIVGSVTIIFLVTVAGESLFTSDTAQLIVIAAILIGICLQELVLHPIRYGQTIRKSLFDIATWTVPIIGYLVLLR